MNCEKCDKDCDNLTSKPAYNGNKDVKYYCDKCFEEVHNE
jgi:hypothetical protein